MSETLQIIKPSKKTPTGLKVLIVEDDPISELLLTISFEELDAKIYTANTGNKAIEICKTEPDLDLILMDIRMPSMNGFLATQHIRAFNKKVIIVAQTAFALTGDREKAIKIGCNDYISKPIDLRKLNQIVLKHLG